MEWFDYLRDKWNVDVIIVVLVFLAGFFQQKYLIGWVWLKDSRRDASVKTLVVSLIFSTIYILIAAKELKRANIDAGTVFLPWGKWFFSYLLTISLYDQGIKPIRNWLKKKTGDTTPDENA